MYEYPILIYVYKFFIPFSLELHNKSIANNPEQLQAVRNIAEGPRNDATYIIFGPPGKMKNMHREK